MLRVLRALFLLYAVPFFLVVRRFLCVFPTSRSCTTGIWAGTTGLRPPLYLCTPSHAFLCLRSTAPCACAMPMPVFVQPGPATPILAQGLTFFERKQLTKGRFGTRVVLVNVPSFRFLGPVLSFFVPSFWFWGVQGTSAKTTVLTTTLLRTPQCWAYPTQL